MQGYNLIVLYTPDEGRVLMCHRRKEPYKGLDNMPGGKIEQGEDGLAAAYRELLEETGVTARDVTLRHVMDFVYYYQECYVEVYAGRLRQEKEVAGDENDLFWSDFDHNFFDGNAYAGEGNIGHILEQVKLYRREIFD